MSTNSRGSRPPKGAVIMVVVALVGLVGVFLATRPAAGEHPDPRPTPPSVLDAAAFAGYERIQETYTMAAAIPNVLDGLYCHCDCEHHSGHYSLLDCFTDDHGAGCDICLTEAQLAYRMTQEGKSLDEIREAIDALYAH